MKAERKEEQPAGVDEMTNQKTKPGCRGTPRSGEPRSGAHNFRPAFTLIELLAVIVIVSLVAGLATVGLASTSKNARLHATAAEWRDLDTRARLFGRSLGPVMMSLDNDRHQIALRVIESNELLSTLDLPGRVTARLHTQPPTESIVFDRLGRSVDYESELHTAQRTIRWRICGLSGLITEAAP